MGLRGLHFGGFADGQDRARHVIGPVGGAALAALIPGLHVDAFERLKTDIFGHVDRLGDGTVDPTLCGSLHAHVIFWCQRLRVYKVIRQVHFAELLTPECDGIINHFFLGPAAILL